MDGQDRLADLMRKTGAFQHSPDRPFTLASGEKSEYYFDLRRLTGDPEGIALAAELVYGMVRKLGGVRSIGGLEAGSIAIASAVSMHSMIERRRDPQAPALSSFYVRKEPKGHGTKRLIEGLVESPAVIIDDVITSGGSALRAADAVEGEGHSCAAVACIVFRGTDSHRAAIESRAPLLYVLHGGALAGGAP